MVNRRTTKSSMLTYAINSEGRLVHVDNVPNGNKCGCICPACKEPLIAKNQGKTKREHHFAHQSDEECTWAHESMLHLMAKEKIQEEFLTKDTFYIKYNYHSYCSHSKECNKSKYSGECFNIKYCQYNLKDYYDSCEQEKVYDNIKRRSDLKIFSSTHPERKPIYIEFCVTHASDTEKLHSDNKIIEMLIDSEESINSIINEGGINSSRAKFYNFKDSDYQNNNISCKVEFVRYILYKSGKSRCFQDVCDCKNITRTNNALYEVCFHTFVSLGVYEYAKYLGYQKFRINNCLVCKNYVPCYDGIGRICKMYKLLQIPKYEPHDTSRATTCKYFRLNEEEMENELNRGCRWPYTVLE